MRPGLLAKMINRIDQFVTRLADTVVDGPVVNQYAAECRQSSVNIANAIRRENLRVYLQAMSNAGPHVMLIGEAPGYRGCRLTGVPFTSEAILLDRRIWPFGSPAGFRKTAERETVAKEATATMVWSALAHSSPPPLLWNAFPFHPHKAGSPGSNRRPNKQELLQGAAILSHLTDLLSIRAVGAVGRCAASALDFAGVHDYHLLRHPSHGGKSVFEAGLSHLLATAPPSA